MAAKQAASIGKSIVKLDVISMLVRQQSATEQLVEFKKFCADRGDRQSRKPIGGGADIVKDRNEFIVLSLEPGGMCRVERSSSTTRCRDAENTERIQDNGHINRFLKNGAG